MSRAQVLIVDDDPALLEALPEALRLRIRRPRRRYQRFRSDALEGSPKPIRRPGGRHQDAGHGRPGAPDGDKASSPCSHHPDHRSWGPRACRSGAAYRRPGLRHQADRSRVLRLVVESGHRVSPTVAGSRQKLRGSLHHPEEPEACVQERTVELREALHREQVARRELDEAKRRLGELRQERDLFVTMVAHDLATPLTTIRGWVEFSAADADPERRERARDAHPRPRPSDWPVWLEELHQPGPGGRRPVPDSDGAE